MEWGWEEILYENAKNFNNVCSLYGIAQTFSGNGWLKWRGQPNSDIVAFCWIDREAPIYQPILDIEGGRLQNVALYAWWDHLDVVAENNVITLMTFVSPGKAKVQIPTQFSLSLEYAKRVMLTCYACQYKFGNASLSLGLHMLNRNK